MSLLTSSTSLCELCPTATACDATVLCTSCGLELCFPCAYSRHFLGSLTQHKFELLPFSTKQYQAARLEVDENAPKQLQPHELCEWCEVEPNMLRCPICEIRFCAACADSFHHIASKRTSGSVNSGKGTAARATWLAHKLKFEYVRDTTDYLGADQTDFFSHAAASSGGSTHLDPSDLTRPSAQSSAGVSPMHASAAANAGTFRLPTHQRVYQQALMHTRLHSQGTLASGAHSNNSSVSPPPPHTTSPPIDRRMSAASLSVPPTPHTGHTHRKNNHSSPNLPPTGAAQVTNIPSIDTKAQPSQTGRALSHLSPRRAQHSRHTSREERQDRVLEFGQADHDSSDPDMSFELDDGSQVKLPRFSESRVSPNKVTDDAPVERDRTRRLSVNVEEHADDEAPQLPSPSRTRSLTAALAVPSSTMNALASPRKLASSVSTFKLANAVLGYTSTPCPAKSEANFQIALDSNSYIFTITSNEKDHTGMHYCRHLSAIHSIHIDPSDPKRMTITFRESSRPGGVGAIMIKAYAMTLSEARVIEELLRLMISEYEAKVPPPDSTAGTGNGGSIPEEDSVTTPTAATAASSSASASGAVSPEREIADTDIIYIGRVLKRGKMSWAPRWLLLKKFHLRVYKTPKLHIPSNNISLSGAKITINEEKDKHLTLICMDRSYTFKMADVIERDNVLSLFQKAMEMRQRADGSLALSAIGGAMPVSSNRGSFSTTTAPQPGSLTSRDDRADSFHNLPGLHREGSFKQSREISLNQRRSTMPSNLRDDTTETRAASGSVRFAADTIDDNSSASSSAAASGKRRKSRRTISRDFHSILSKTPHSLAVDEVTNFASSKNVASKIEFAEFAIDSSALHVRPSKTLLSGVYSLMKLLSDSMHNGAHVSPTLYVPKTVWYQHGAKFQAFAVKLDVLETLRVALLTLLPPKAADQSAGVQAMCEELEAHLVNFRMVCEDAQNKLAQHLSFIHTVKESRVGETSSASSLSLSEKLSKGMKTFAKTVSRAASATKDKVDQEDTTRYIKLLDAIFDQAQLFREWIMYIDSPTCQTNNKAALEEHFNKISEFFYCVLCNITIRDLKTLLKRYVKHCMRTLVSH